MKALIFFVGWCILFVLCWPLALLALILYPIVWLILIPFRFDGLPKNPRGIQSPAHVPDRAPVQNEPAPDNVIVYSR